MGQNQLDDGEFWMEFFTDFCREFEEVSICTLGPDFNHDGVVDASTYTKDTPKAYTMKEKPKINY